MLAHSESGHHHVVERPGVTFYQDPTDPVLGWLEVHGTEDFPLLTGDAIAVHQKTGSDAHCPIRLPEGRYRVHRGTELTPRGWEAVQD